MPILLTNATIVTCNPDREILYNSALAVDKGRIAALGPTPDLLPQFPDAELVTCRGKTVFPGLINAHTHLMRTVGRGILEDTGYPNTLQHPEDIRDILTPDETLAMVTLGALESIKSGATAVLEIGKGTASYAHALSSTGLRLVLSEAIDDLDPGLARLGHYDYSEEKRESRLQAGEALVKEWHGAAYGRITCFMAPGTPESCSPQLLRSVREIAERYDIGYTIHLCQSMVEMDAIQRIYGTRPTHYLFANEFLSPRLLTAHNRYVDHSEIAMLGWGKVNISNNPAIAARRGTAAPVLELKAAGCNIAMGSDNMTQDMVEVLRSGVFYERVRRNSQMHPMPEDVLRWATMGSARALRIDDKVGSLEPGKHADLFIINSSRAHLVPNLRIVSAFVHNGQAGDVESVMIDGKWVMRDRQVLTIDEPRVVEAAQEVGTRAWQRLLDRYPNVPFPFTLTPTPT